MEDNPLRTTGIVLIVIGVVLILGGILAYFLAVPTERGWIYLFRGMGIWSIGLGFTAVIIGAILFAYQKYL